MKTTSHLLKDLAAMAVVSIVYICTIRYILPWLIGPDVLHMIHMSATFGIIDKYSFLATTAILTGLSVQTSFLGLWSILFLMLAALMFTTLSLLNGLGWQKSRYFGFFILSFLWPYSVFLFTYANRDTIFSLTLTAAILSCANLLKYTNEKHKRRQFFMWYVPGLLVGLSCVLRPEAIVMVPFFILGFFLVTRRDEVSLQGARWLNIITVVMVITFNSVLKSEFFPTYTTQQNYSATAYLNPLSTILSDPEIVANLPESDRDILFTVIDKDRIRPNIGNIPAFFNGTFDQEAYIENQKSFDDAAIRTLINHPGKFLGNRFTVFASSQGLGEDYNLIPLPPVGKVVNSKYLNSPPSAAEVEVTRSRFRALMQVDDANPLSLTLWNMGLALLIYLALLLKWKKAPLTSLLILAQFARCGVVFLTAPATFTIYYATLQTGLFPIVLMFFIERKFGRQLFKS